MKIHHGKHHNAYVNQLNKALEGQPIFRRFRSTSSSKKPDRVPENIRTVVRNNGGGIGITRCFGN